jgi:RNA polymerase sigma-70 factor (ECF subfamily)
MGPRVARAAEEAGPSARPPAGGAPSWPEVLARAVDGDGAASRTIYLELRRPVHAYLRVQGVEDPDDLTSEVFLRVFRGLGDFDGDETGFRSWVFGIAHARVVDERRRRARRPEVIDLRDGVGGTGGDVEEEALRAVGDGVHEALASLTPEQRDVLFFRVVADLSLEETADALGKPVGAVKALQHRALASARRHLGVATV